MKPWIELGAVIAAIGLGFTILLGTIFHIGISAYQYVIAYDSCSAQAAPDAAFAEVANCTYRIVATLNTPIPDAPSVNGGTVGVDY